MFYLLYIFWFCLFLPVRPINEKKKNVHELKEGIELYLCKLFSEKIEKEKDIKEDVHSKEQLMLAFSAKSFLEKINILVDNKNNSSFFSSDENKILQAFAEVFAEKKMDGEELIRLFTKIISVASTFSDKTLPAKLRKRESEENIKAIKDEHYGKGERKKFTPRPSILCQS